MQYTFKTKGVCSQLISFEIEDNKVSNVQFFGGCNGNLKAISSLVDGLTVSQIEERVKGITCGFKNTSCSDQLSKAVRKAYEENK